MAMAFQLIAEEGHRVGVPLRLGRDGVTDPRDGDIADDARAVVGRVVKPHRAVGDPGGGHQAVGRKLRRRVVPTPVGQPRAPPLGHVAAGRRRAEHVARHGVEILPEETKGVATLLQAHLLGVGVRVRVRARVGVRARVRVRVRVRVGVRARARVRVRVSS